MKTNPMRAIAGGLAGTALMTLMMYFLAPMMIGHAMDMAEMLGKMMGNSWGLGMLAHLMNGIIIFPLIYTFFVYENIKGAPVTRGIAWGVILWLLAALIGHVVYGGTLGAIAGKSESLEVKPKLKHA